MNTLQLELGGVCQNSVLRKMAGFREVARTFVGSLRLISF